jgi:hypothetical protein
MKSKAPEEPHADFYDGRNTGLHSGLLAALCRQVMHLPNKPAFVKRTSMPVHGGLFAINNGNDHSPRFGIGMAGLQKPLKSLVSDNGCTEKFV